MLVVKQPQDVKIYFGNVKLSVEQRLHTFVGQHVLASSEQLQMYVIVL
jgi:hypothetical protein